MAYECNQLSAKICTKKNLQQPRKMPFEKIKAEIVEQNFYAGMIPIFFIKNVAFIFWAKPGFNL